MELTNKNNFDPTPKLKSSPIPILFLPFNNEKLRCNNCGNKYSTTYLYEQKYCKQCLLLYIENIADNTDNNKYFDVNIMTINTHCIEHKSTRKITFFTKSIQEWCVNCSEILYFNNYYDYVINTTTKCIRKEKDCKLCEKKFVDKNTFEIKLCSNCYLISSGWTKSILTNKPIPILHLPWWDASNKSRVCNHNLKFLTDCKKWCSYCFIVYVGCRYCLTTNIIFGIIDQTQCKKCKRISNINIDIEIISSGNHDIDEFLISTRTNTDNHDKFANYMNNSDKNSNPLNVYNFIEHKLINFNYKRTMEWIPYSQINNLEKIAEGGFGIIYKAIWLNKTSVAVKRFSKSHIINFLNEVKSLHRCYDSVFIVKYYGITQDPVIKDYMLIMEYARGGNLHSYLQKNFTDIKWTTKLAVLCQISDGCWDSNLLKRPSIAEIKETVDGWYKKRNKTEIIFSNAEEQRIGLIQLKQLGPKFTEKQHPGAIYTSRPIKSLISQVSSLNSSSTISNQVSNQVYTSEEYKFDIDNSHDTQRQTISRSSSIKSSSGYISNDLDFDIETNTQRLTTFESIRSSSIKSSSGYISKDLDIDIETNTQRLSTININSMSHPNAIYTSRPLSALISHVRNNRN
ncbi:uncharacterized protein OCT59_011564 [Rhizophagus irregularis]|uniref:uncharacterized protein n=1 Tax=Rhizophagus irregularis TaxID=588596 RepID=UPI00332EE3E0|nr:hypothetical protein OCT59_011564 [Rhizophagus irregularis]